MLALTPGDFEECGAMNVGSELGYYIDIFRPSY
jgi:hypothetical protein